MTRRVFALSDVHIDYEVNAAWIGNLSQWDYRDDVLVLAGDISDRLERLEWCLKTLAGRFRSLLFLPGNHDLWVLRDRGQKTSLQKFAEVCQVARASGASMQPYRAAGFVIHPLLGWYDYSFGAPSEELKAIWMDYHACRWPVGYGAEDVTAYFTDLNSTNVDQDYMVMTFSHFLPRIDLMPSYISAPHRVLYPILGCEKLDQQLRYLKSSIHVYGHSHVNRDVVIGGVRYVNNAFGYPKEALFAAKRLLCVHEY